MSESNGTPKLAKFSVAMIARNNSEKDLGRALSSIAPYADDIVVVNTAITESEDGYETTNAVAKKYGARVYHFPWVEDFSAARNFSFEKCAHDAVLWLDSDDTIDNAKQFVQCIRQAFGSGECEALYAEYLYEFDEAGNCTSVLQRERVVDRRFFEWRAPIHEVLCEKYRVRADRIPPELGRIRHHHVRNDAGQQVSMERNLRVIEHHYLPVEKGGKGEYSEERMLFYWAQTLMVLGRLEEAIQKYLEYIPRSGSNAEIQHALGHASECARLLRKLPEAKALAHQAIERNIEAPTPYWFLAAAHMKAGDNKLAAHYALLCLERAERIGTEMVSNPKVVYGGSALLAAESHFNAGYFKEVEPLLKIAEKYYGPTEPRIVKMRQYIGQAIHRANLLQSYNNLVCECEKSGRHADVRALARTAPKEIRDAPEVARYLPKERPLGKKTVIFLAGGGMPNGWGPELLKTGIAGSEEAVVYLSEQFAKKGWHVEVYPNCTRQTWNGVEWYPFPDFAGDDDDRIADVAIVWRTSWMMLDVGIRARRTYLWLHDMPNPAWWLEGIWNGFDGIFGLSQFHIDQYDFVPKEKFILTGNGLPVDRLPPVDQLANEPHRLIYASDMTRGLELVLVWWEKIKKEVPEAELDIYYGIHPTLAYQATLKAPLGRAHAQVIQRVQLGAKQPGINWKGFVGQEELQQGTLKAGVWAYPCVFPEISCITGMRMQALGVTPVTSNQFALAETVRHGVKIDGDMRVPLVQQQWFEAVVNALKNPMSREQRIEMALDARSAFDWAKVADQWIGVFNDSLSKPHPDRVYKRRRMDLIRASA